MEIEKERGISVTSSVLQFNYDGYCINILDTPGHQDFSEDTYRTLMAADSAVMVIDGSKGVEAQTIKLFKVCAMRGIPVFTFINKMDREANDPFELIDEIETVLGMPTCPVNWPIGSGKNFKGVYDRQTKTISHTHGEALVSGCPEQGLIVAVAVAREVVVAVYRAALDVNPDLWPLAEGLGLRLGVGRIKNIVEGTGLTIDDVQTSGKLLARPGTRHQIVLGTTGDIEGGIRGHIVIDKDIERLGCLDIDARGVSHVGAAGGAEQIIPVAGIAIGRIVVDAEVLLVGCPAAVLQLQGNGGHEVGHTGSGECGGEFVVRHSLVFAPQASAGGILEEGVAQFVHPPAPVVLQRIEVFQASHESAVLGPGGLLVFLERHGIDTQRGFRGEDVGAEGRGREGLQIDQRDGRIVEGTLLDVGHMAADEHRGEGGTVGKGAVAQPLHAARHLGLAQRRIGKGTAADGGHRGGQHHVAQTATLPEHVLADDVVLGPITLVVCLAAAHYANAGDVERHHRAVGGQLTQVLDIGAIEGAGQLQHAPGAGEQSGERAGLLHIHLTLCPQVRCTETGDEHG